MKKITTTKVEVGTHKKVVTFSLSEGAVRGKRMSLSEAYRVLVDAGIGCVKRKNKKT